MALTFLLYNRYHSTNSWRNIGRSAQCTVHTQCTPTCVIKPRRSYGVLEDKVSTVAENLVGLKPKVKQELRAHRDLHFMSFIPSPHHPSTLVSEVVPGTEYWNARVTAIVHECYYHSPATDLYFVFHQVLPLVPVLSLRFGDPFYDICIHGVWSFYLLPTSYKVPRQTQYVVKTYLLHLLSFIPLPRLPQ